MEDKTASPATDAQDLDERYSLLSDRQRRCVVEILSEEDPPIALRELATEVASRETEAGSENVPSDTIDEIAVTLHHIHLPKLDAANIVDYDVKANTVASARTKELATLRPSDGAK